jgi:RNA polymerase sigma-70 factor (ECF subfamily)
MSLHQPSKSYTVYRVVENLDPVLESGVVTITVSAFGIGLAGASVWSAFANENGSAPDCPGRRVEVPKDKDQDPLLAVYLERRAELERHFSVRLRSPEAARDLVQDMFLKIARRPPGAIDNPTAFLYRLGSNLMLDHVKRQQSRHRKVAAWGDVYGPVAGGEVAAEEPAADDALMSRERLRLVVEAVQELPAQAREAFRLHKLEGLSHAETAAAMGVSRSSVEKYLMTCLKRILARTGS